MAEGFLKDYEPVEDRLREFWSDHPEGSVITKLLAHEGGVYIVHAEVYRKGSSLASPDATGLAQDSVEKLPNNMKASALEVCETSAIGRALANLGYAAKGKRPSREEMQKSADIEPASEVRTGGSGMVEADGSGSRPGGTPDPTREESAPYGEGGAGSHDPQEEQRQAYIKALREGPGLPSAFTMAKALFNTDANKRVRNMREFHELSVDELFQVAAAFEERRQAAPA